MRDRLVNALDSLDGARIRGGCDQCDAYQTVQAVSAGVLGHRCAPRHLVPGA